MSIINISRTLKSYGEPLVCTYGNQVRVYESSAAISPHVWVNVEMGDRMEHYPGEAILHLNRQQAQELINRLQAWLIDHPQEE